MFFFLYFFNIMKPFIIPLFLLHVESESDTIKNRFCFTFAHIFHIKTYLYTVSCMTTYNYNLNT